MSEVRQWLRDLGLEEYAKAFEAERLEFADLVKLDAADLKELGLQMGPRKRVLEGIDQLRGAGDLRVLAKSPTAEPAQAIHSTAERRQLTVMFCDMVGYTQLASGVDPEELQDIVRVYEDTCAAAITRYDGYVFQRLGDGIVAFFGYPLAHEGEAERAIRAGLDIIEAFGELDVPNAGRLKVRIGIATGMVVVTSAEKGAVGETMNLAARLQSVAAVNTVVISERVRQLAGGSFDYEDLGERTLKGIQQATHAHQVVGISEATSRFEAAHSEILTPLVGRDLELGLLMDRWARAREGEGQVVLLGGEPGIGKSRILSTLREKLEDEGAKAMRFQCSPYYVNSAFWPSIDNLERTLKFTRTEPVESKLDKLESLVVDHYKRPIEDVRFLASILAIPCDERYAKLSITPQKFKDETLRTLVDLTKAAAKKRPSVMLFEDLHWADPTTFEFLDLMIDRVRPIPLLIVLTHRPEFQNRWVALGHVAGLNLSKLTRTQSGAIVSRLMGGKALPEELFEQIIARTDGVPLFVEELTKSVLESGELKEEADRYEYVGSARSLIIPATLRDSLMARLDRYSPVKEIAQIGSAIGREFSYELIAAVAPMSEVQLKKALEKLTGSGLVFQKGEPPHAVYMFKHALIQDVAYDSLLKRKLRVLHAAIAQAIEKLFPDIGKNEPELLAHHYTFAEDFEKAAHGWFTSGKQSLGRTALQEALSQLEKALSLVEKIPESRARDQFELDLRLTLGTAYFAFLGWVAIEVKNVLEPARELARRLGDYEKLLPITYFIWFHHGMRSEYSETVAAAEEIQDIADQTNDSKARVTGSLTRACTHLWQGEFKQARAIGEDALAVYDYEKHRGLAQIYNHDVKCLTLIWAGAWYWLLGYPDKAHAACIEQLEHAKKVGHPFNLLWGLSGGSIGLLLRRETDLLVKWLKELRVIGRELGMPIADFLSSLWGGYALIEEGRYREGYDQLSPGAQHWRQTGGLHLVPYANLMQARALARMAEFSAAGGLIEDALSVIDTTGHRMHEAEVYRVRGEITLLEDPEKRELAERDFQISIRIATGQRAKGWELRTSTSLARLWQSQGKEKNAHDLLSPVYNWFTEGFDTKDLKEAKALLEELAA
jgi:class 3 adenylate cyclase/predicted ATPase